MALDYGQGFVDRGVGTLSCSRRNVPVSGRDHREGWTKTTMEMGIHLFPCTGPDFLRDSSQDHLQILMDKTKRQSDHLPQATGYKAWKAMRASSTWWLHSVHNGMRIGRSILKEWDTPLPKSKRCLLSRCESWPSMEGCLEGPWRTLRMIVTWRWITLSISNPCLQKTLSSTWRIFASDCGVFSWRDDSSPYLVITQKKFVDFCVHCGPVGRAALYFWWGYVD